MDQYPDELWRGEQSLAGTGGESRDSDGTRDSDNYSGVVVVPVHVVVQIDAFPSILSTAVPTRCATIKGKYTSMATSIRVPIPYKRRAAC